MKMKVNSMPVRWDKDTDTILRILWINEIHNSLKKMLMEGLWRKEASKEIQEDDFHPLLFHSLHMKIKIYSF